MAVRDGGAQALSPRGATARAGHVGGGPGLVNEHQMGRVKIELFLEPGLATRQDVRPVLLGRVGALFFTVIPCRSKNRHSPP